MGKEEIKEEEASREVCTFLLEWEREIYLF